MNKRLYITIILVLLVISLIHSQSLSKGNAELNEALVSINNDIDKIPVYILLSQQYDENKLYNDVMHLPQPERRSQTISTLQHFSSVTQEALKNDLELLEKEYLVSNVRYLWLVNMVALDATKEALYKLDHNSDIDVIVYDPEVNVLFPGSEESRPLRQEDIPRGNNNSTRNPANNVSVVRAPAVWDQGYEGAGVVVAVLDTGVDYRHRDIADRMWINQQYPNHGYNFISNNNNPLDDNGHGTHCAGTVAGDGTAGIATGVAPQSSIMAIKVLTANGGAQIPQTVSGVQFAIENGADVLSISYGWRNPPVDTKRTLRTSMVNTLSAGVIASVALGNFGTQQGQYQPPNNIGLPGGCPAPWLHPDQTLRGGLSAVISVGATDDADAVANFSSRGPAEWSNVTPFNDYQFNPGLGLIVPDITAPGVNVNSLRYNTTGGYETKNGTSMAAPAVAGIIALMLSKDHLLTPEEISQIIEENAVRLAATKNNNIGSGRIDALNVIEAVVGTNPPNPAVRPIPDNGAEFIASTPTLRWSNGGGAREYNVYLGTDNPPTNALNGVNTENRYIDISQPLIPERTYYWRIDSVNPNGVRTGTVWNFETSTPNQATDPEPAPNALDVRIMPMLRWFNGGGATSYRVYLGTDNPPTNVLNGVDSDETNYQVVAELEPQTLHYWKIDATNDNGFTAGNVWSFTTGIPPGEGFETGDFSVNDWRTEFSGANAVPWFVDDEVSFSGQYAARSGAIGHSSTTTLLITLELFEPGQISFARKVSTELNFDFLGFYIDNTLVQQWSGELDWDEFTYDVTPGRRTFKWVYSKNPTGVSGQDAVWIDDVTFPELSVPAPELNPPDGVTSAAKLDHINLKWNLPAERPIILGYNIYRSDNNEENFSKINNTLFRANSYRDNISTAGTYYYYVTSVFENGESLPSQIVSTTLNEAVAQPTFTPDEGEYNEPIQVALITDVEDALIYFTIDGTNPNSESLLYQEPVSVSETTLFKARAFKIGHLPSELIEAQYIISLAAEENLHSDEPVFVSVYPNPVIITGSIVHGGGQGINIAYSFSEPREATIQIFNIKGQLIRDFSVEQDANSRKSIIWDLQDNRGRQVGSGLYLINVQTSEQQIVKRLLILN